jgi:hypothetical protein
VQKIIKSHYVLTSKLWTPGAGGYVILADLYGAHPEFIEFYATIHPNLLSFLQAGMKVYAKNCLT